MRIDLAKDSWLAGLIDFIYPPICIGCGRYSEDEYSICESCRKLFDLQNNPFCLNCLSAINPIGIRCQNCGVDSFPLLVFASYKPPLTEIIKQFKFKGITKSSSFFSKSIIDKYGTLFKGIEQLVLVPIPLHSSREKYRGFNQAKILSEHLAKFLEVGINSNILERTKKRKPQSQLLHKDRKTNIKDVFEINESEIELNILLVDDVVTTGQTVFEAKKMLNKAGHRVHGVVAIAHAV